MDPIIDDKQIAAKAVSFVVNSSRKGVVALCADVANLIKTNATLYKRVRNLEKELEETKNSFLYFKETQTYSTSPAESSSLSGEYFGPNFEGHSPRHDSELILSPDGLNHGFNQIPHRSISPVLANRKSHNPLSHGSGHLSKHSHFPQHERSKTMPPQVTVVDSWPPLAQGKTSSLSVRMQQQFVTSPSVSSVKPFKSHIMRSGSQDSGKGSSSCSQSTVSSPGANGHGIMARRGHDKKVREASFGLRHTRPSITSQEMWIEDETESKMTTNAETRSEQNISTPTSSRSLTTFAMVHKPPSIIIPKMDQHVNIPNDSAPKSSPQAEPIASLDIDSISINEKQSKTSLELDPITDDVISCLSMDIGSDAGTGSSLNGNTSADSLNNSKSSCVIMMDNKSGIAAVTSNNNKNERTSSTSSTTVELADEVQKSLQKDFENIALNLPGLFKNSQERQNQPEQKSERALDLPNTDDHDLPKKEANLKPNLSEPLSTVDEHSEYIAATSAFRKHQRSSSEHARGKVLAKNLPMVVLESDHNHNKVSNISLHGDSAKFRDPSSSANEGQPVITSGRYRKLDNRSKKLTTPNNAHSSANMKRQQPSKPLGENLQARDGYLV